MTGMTKRHRLDTLYQIKYNKGWCVDLYKEVIYGKKD